jgi:UDP-2,3-diacylglucosamine pyrophosphatase LpxH
MIIAVSDIHLGYEKSNSESFRKFIDECAKIEIEHFVILGDLMDFWRANIAQVITDYQDILDRIGRLHAENIYYVPGNHDYYINKLVTRYPDSYPFKVSHRLRLTDNGKVFNLMHGHELEVYANLEPLTIDAYEKLSEHMCFTERITGGIATRIWDMVENREDMSQKADIMRKPPHERNSLDRVHMLAVSKGVYVLLGMHPGDCLVYGHTHKPFINEEKTVANTGSWVDEGPKERPRNTYIVIDGGRMELRTFGSDPFP